MYKIQAYCVSDGHRYPKYELSVYHEGYTESLSEAESLIKDYVAHNEYYMIHHFLVEKEPMGTFRNSYWEREDAYTYDERGNLIDKNLVSSFSGKDGCLPTFWGRAEADVRFKPGDIVEVLNGDTIELEFVVAVPTSPAEAERINHGRLGPILDYSDDCYVTLTDGDYASHSHPGSLNLFEPMFKIPKPTENRLNKAFKEFVEKDFRYSLEYHKGKYWLMVDECCSITGCTERSYLAEKWLGQSVELRYNDHAFLLNGQRKKIVFVESLDKLPNELKEKAKLI